MEKNIRLTNGIITLRPYQTSDVEPLYQAARESIPEVSVWMPWCHPDYTIEESKEFIEKLPEQWEKGTGYGFAITDTDTGLYLGGCGIGRIQPDWGGRIWGTGSGRVIPRRESLLQ